MEVVKENYPEKNDQHFYAEWIQKGISYRLEGPRGELIVIAGEHNYTDFIFLAEGLAKKLSGHIFLMVRDENGVVDVHTYWQHKRLLEAELTEDQE
jgi:hypothetical protein